MVQEDWILNLEDNEWPLTTIDHDRMIARAIVVDDEGCFYFVRANRDDDFGKATLIETAGGGVETGEDLDTAIRRELKEELGADVEVLCKIGVVSDYYNLINRHNVNNYYLCKVKSFGDKHLTKDAIDDFHLSTLKLRYDEALAEYDSCRCTSLGRLIANREVPVLKRAKELLQKIRVESFSIDYLQDYFDGFDEDITRYQWPDPFESIDDARELLQGFLDEAESGETILLSVLSENGELIGSSEIHGLSEDCPEVGVWIKKTEWNKGYAYIALKKALDIARIEYGKKEFFYEADIRNIGSMKLLQKFEGEYEITEQELEKVTTDSGKELELQGYIMKVRE